MQEKVFYTQRKAAVALCIVLLVLTQQVCAGPLVARVESKAESSDVITLRRVARMTPLWRIMNSKPLGAYCQNNYECSTGLCRTVNPNKEGRCSSGQRTPSEKY